MRNNLASDASAGVEVLHRSREAILVYRTLVHWEVHAVFICTDVDRRCLRCIVGVIPELNEILELLVTSENCRCTDVRDASLDLHFVVSVCVCLSYHATHECVCGKRVT